MSSGVFDLRDAESYSTSVEHPDARKHHWALCIIGRSRKLVKFAGLRTVIVKETTLEAILVSKKRYRTERDSMGPMPVPEDALYGAQTARAVLNFPISGHGIGREMIKALAAIKAAAAEVNHDLGKLDQAQAQAIIAAAEEVAAGDLDDHFPVDIFQTGSGTSSNMNTNEVIARRALQLSHDSPPIHPNDHVNMGQSSNDVFPTAIHLAAIQGIEGMLVPALNHLHSTLLGKTKQFDSIVTTGRTHLQDATPIRLGQVFSGYARQIEFATDHIEANLGGLRELAIGGTATGTGINTHPEFGARVTALLSTRYNTRLVEAVNHFEAQSARDAAVRASGSMKALAAALIKISNDLRWLASGPRLGLGELELPAVQPGSSIMPAKVNPVIAEALIQVAVQVMANDTAISIAGMYGNFQLNTMMPLIARNLLEQINLLGRAVPLFNDRLVAGIEARTDHIAANIDRSLALATALAPVIGYERAAAIAKQAQEENRTIAEIARSEGILDEDQLLQLLDPMRQTKPESTEE